jgi:hypothetical protein
MIQAITRSAPSRAGDDPFLSRTADQQPSYGESGSVHREQQTVASVFPFLIQLDNVFP